MSDSTIALIIILAAVVLFVTERLPVSVTALAAMLAMGFFGIISWADAFSGMSSSIVMFLIGASILGEAYFTTGLADKIGNAILHVSKNGMTEKKLILILFAIGTIWSAFFNGAMIVAVMFPIIDSVAKSSNGAVSRKQLYLPTAISTIFGSNMTTIGSTSMMLAVGLLADSALPEAIPFFEPAKIGLAGVIVSLVAYCSFAYPMQKRVFSFDEIEPDWSKVVETPQNVGWRCWFVAALTAACILAVALGMNYGAAALLTALILISTDCIDVKSAFRGVSWEMIFVVVGSLGFAKGLSVSGAGELIADTIMALSGPLRGNAFAMCVIVLFLGTLISNFMSNGATVSIVAPIGIMLAQALGVSAIPFVLAAAVGANISISTPVCVTQITMSLSVGYRFKDLIKVGGTINLIAFAATAIALKLFYFL